MILAAAMAPAACAVDDRTPLPVGVAGADGSSEPRGDGAASAPSGSGADAGDLGSEGANAGDLGSEGADGELGLEEMQPNTAPPSSPPLIGANLDAYDFGAVHAAGTTPPTFDWVITNSGGSSSGALSLSNTNELQFPTENGCSAPLEPGAACIIRVSFAPETTGSFAGALSLAHGAGTSSLALTGKGQNQMTITVVGNGAVSSSPPGLTCEGDRCTGLFDPVVVTFTARTENGSGSFPALWNAGNCRARQTCAFTMSRSGAATVRFHASTHNIVFTSSARYDPNLGGLAAYDAECNRLASEAGINDASGDAFIAAMSDSSASLRQRLGSARGWVRMDGLPFADTATELFDAFDMRYYAAYDERGVQVPTSANALSGSDALNTLTGTLANGSAAPNTCNDWTSNSVDASFNMGRASGGPTSWLAATTSTCDSQLGYRVVCMGVSRSNALPPRQPPPQGSKQIWVTNTPFVPGSMTPDAKCQSERPAGVSNAVAFSAYTDRPAADVIDPAGVYFRPDGQLVGTGADLINRDVYTGLWIRADGTPRRLR